MKKFFKNWRKYVMIVFPLIILAIAIIFELYVRFSHPEMTETQLFLRYLPAWIVIFAGLIGSMFLFKSK